MSYRAASSDAVRTFRRVAIALAFSLIVGLAGSPIRASDAKPVSQRVIAPAQAAALSQALAHLPKGRIKLMLWAGPSSMKVNPGPGPGPHHLTDDQIEWVFNDPDNTKPLTDNSEIIIFAKQLARILKASGYEVKMDAAAGSPTVNVSLDALSHSALPVTAAMQSALAASGIKVFSGGDGTEGAVLHSPEMICIRIGRQASRS